MSLALAGTVLALGTGCVATSGGSADLREAHQQQDAALIQEKLRRVEGDLESLNMQLENMRGDLQRIQANRAHATSAQDDAMRANLSSVESRIQNLEAQREKDRREIVETVSRTVAEMMNRAAPAPTRSQGGTPGPSGYGYEHVVQAGETLSRIAQAYGTTVSAIKAANNIQNPDMLIVGATLVIPE